MFVAGIWAAAGGRGDEFDRQEELYGGLFFAAGGLLCMYGAFAIWGRGQAKRHRRLRGTKLSVNGGPIRRGDEVSVTVTRRRAGDPIEVGLACDERYDVEVPVTVKGASTVMRQTAVATIHEHWQTVPTGARDGVFQLSLPVDLPYSYEGGCVSYAWRVSARAAKPLRKDARLDQPIWVEP
jgi:hypothetical protein